MTYPKLPDFCVHTVYMYTFIFKLYILKQTPKVEQTFHTQLVKFLDRSISSARESSSGDENRPSNPRLSYDQNKLHFFSDFSSNCRFI